MADDEGFFRSLLNRGSSGDGYTWDAVVFDQLMPTDFETAVEALFTAEGYDVERAGPTVEGRIDLIAKQSGLIRSKTTVVAVRHREGRSHRGLSSKWSVPGR